MSAINPDNRVDMYPFELAVCTEVPKLFAQLFALTPRSKSLPHVAILGCGESISAKGVICVSEANCDANSERRRGKEREEREKKKREEVRRAKYDGIIAAIVYKIEFALSATVRSFARVRSVVCNC